MSRVSTVIFMDTLMGMLILSMAFLTGCGRSEPPSNSVPPVLTGGGGYPVGPSAVCLPLSNGLSIGFSGSNAGFIQSSSGQGMLVAGAIPPNSSNQNGSTFSMYAGQTYGVVNLSPGGYPQYSGSGYSYYGTAISDFGVPEASLNVSVTPLQQGPVSSGFPIPLGSANITGVLQILSLNSGYNTGYSGGSLPYNPIPLQQPIAPQTPSGCVSGLALTLNFVGGSYVYMGNAYLYLNGTNHGIWFKF